MHKLHSLKVTLPFVAAVFGLASTVSADRPAEAPTGGLTPEAALQKLREGNQRFVAGKLTIASQSTAAVRQSLAGGQKPFAIILTCSDSRVPPEILFDQGLGELFVVRVAGNIPDPIVIGSIEYGAEHLGASLVMVLGHERCGAVQAAVESNGHGKGNIGALVKTVAPALKVAEKECPACQGTKDCAVAKQAELVECTVSTNVKLVAAELPKRSEILKHLVAEKKLQIVAARYDLDDGAVSLLP